jgi:tetratricopeptide (TPR) repeat protein
MVNGGPQGASFTTATGGGARPRQWLGGAVIVLALVAGGAGALWWWSHRDLPPDTPVNPIGDESEWEPPPVAAPGYVGPEACAECHANRVAELRQTRHFVACAEPKAGTMPAGFAPGKGTYATRDPALRFEMRRVDGKFLQTTIQTTAKAEKRTDAVIALAYGAGGVLDEIYFTWHTDGLYELPMAWLHPQQQWAMATYNPYGPGGDFSRAATPRCVECHNTWFEHVPGTASQYKRDNFILGVTCEKCHGPGRDHVVFHKAHPNADTAAAIVHPGHLARERALEVCTQCHSNAIRHRGPAFRYRPGEPLDNYYRTISTRFPENDHVANQVQYLRQSKCFQKSDMTCTTCHHPHRPHDPNQPGAGSRSCLKCHQPAHCAEQERLPSAVRGDCVGCHMPPRVWVNVHMHTQDDQYVPPIRRYQHRIAVDATARQEVLREWYRTQPDASSQKEAARLTRALTEYWLAEADSRRRQYRFLAASGALREAERLDPAPEIREKLRQTVAVQAALDADLARGIHELEQRHFDKAIEALNKVLSVKPDHAVAHGKLGSAYVAAGQRELAVKHLRAVAQHDPDDSSGWMMLGWLAYLDGRVDEAVAVYHQADEVEPFNFRTHYHWALALVKGDRLPEALQHFQKALTIDANHAGACQGIAHVLRQQGQPEGALRYARRAARLTDEQNADVLLTLAETYASTGRFAQAEAAAAKALSVAQASSPGMVPQLRWRLEEWRALAKKKVK